MATILIVDDLSTNRKFLVTVLHHHGHRLIEAADGREGLAAVRAERPDLVITDVLMPVMDGYEFVRQLRLDPATGGIPVVFYTAHYGEREARALARSSGVAYVLTKPAGSATLLAIVNRILAGESESVGHADVKPVVAEIDREHLRLITDKLSEKTGDLGAANARLRAVINIGLELASERDSDRLLETVCVAARDLFGASYITLGVLDRHDGTVHRVVTCGPDAACGIGAADWIATGVAVPGILGTVVADRRTLRGDNPGGDPAALRLPLRHPPVQAFLAAPIASPAHVYGWMCLVGNEGRSFTGDDEGLVMALAGQVGRIYELEHEILERQQAELVARRERDRAQRYLDTAEIILLALDTEGRITLVNRYACAVLGWPAGELDGRDWIETCVPARIRHALRASLQAAPGADLSIVEHPILTQSGEERLIEWRNTVLRDDDGRVIGRLSSGADVTERNRVAEALRTAEERMRFALEAADVGIWDLDYPTGVLRWSATLERHYGLQPGTFARTFDAFVERIHPDDRAAVLETIADAMSSGADFSIQHRTIRPADGSVRRLSGAGRILLGEHGEPVRGVGISLDVTERRTLEEQYYQAQKMQAVGRLAGGVAHDFNNLLTVILGFCELLLADLEPDDQRQADITEIQNAGVSAAGLTRQLLAFSRKQIIEPTVLDLNGIVAGMQGMLARLIGEDVNVVLGLRPGLAPMKADHGQVEQIVMNLAVNARDAMPKGGTLTIATADVELDEEYSRTRLGVKPGPYVALTITDTGSGMTAQVQARLFEPFFTTKGPGQGTGLGLATVHGIVARSGGSIDVTSEVGRGTSFTVYFPKSDAVAVVAEARPPVAPPCAAETVLVVDDAAGLRELTRRLLQRLGYRVLMAASADEALRVFEQNVAIDMLLTDVVMPGGSGPELTRQLVERRPTLKVIYMSGYTEDAIVQHGVISPGIAFVHKPFTSETLGRKIREVFDR